MSRCICSWRLDRPATVASTASDNMRPASLTIVTCSLVSPSTLDATRCAMPFTTSGSASPLRA